MPKKMQDKRSFTLVQSSFENSTDEKSRYIHYVPQKAAEKAAKVQFEKHIDGNPKNKDVEFVYVKMREKTQNSDKDIYFYMTGRTARKIGPSHPMFDKLSKDKKKTKEIVVHDYFAKPLEEEDYEDAVKQPSSNNSESANTNTNTNTSKNAA
jgi:hypothetical protein